MMLVILFFFSLSLLFLYAIQTELQGFGDNCTFLRVFLTAHFSTTK